jgi:hypothetical protein
VIPSAPRKESAALRSIISNLAISVSRGLQ